MKFKKLFFFVIYVIGLNLTYAQTNTISGIVSDNSGPLPGVTVLIKGTNKGAETDFDGKYSIIAKQGDVLVFSFVGMTSKSITVSSSNVINVKLESDNVLNEVVVVAYGSAKKETITSAVTQVDAKQIEARPTGSLAQALQAQSPGLNISTGNGQPGANSTILLRGVNSINGNNEPLFIIDGVPVDEDSFRSLNQADVASVSVLKDASATAIYGNRATGGVIIITTKKGKLDQKLQVRYNGTTGYTFKPTPKFTFTNSKQILEIERERGRGPGAGQYNSFVGSVLGVSGGNPLTDEEIARISSQTDTNWTDILLRTGQTTSHNLSFSSGSEKVSSYTSLGYFEQEGITVRSKLQRMTFRNNSSFTTDRFNLSTNLTVGFSRSDIAGGIGLGARSGSLSNPFLGPYVSKPYLPAYNDDGSLNILGDTRISSREGFYNTPYIIQNVARFDKNRETEIKAVGGLNASYDITKNIKASYGFGIDFREEIAFTLEPNNSIRGSRRNLSAEFKGRQSEDLLRDTRLNSNFKLSYTNTFNDIHNVSLFGIAEFLYSERSGFDYTQTGLVPGLEGVGAAFIPGNTTEDPDGDGVANYFYIPIIGSFKQNVSQFSYFGKGAYDYDSKTGFDITVRRDASSRFNATNKWGTFWAVGAFANLTKFLFESTDLVNDLKLRGSYGITGNDRVQARYYSGLNIPFDLFETGNGYNGSVGLYPSQIGNPNLKWETTTKANIGVDFVMLKNRFVGSLDFYKNTTDDIFIGRPNTGVSGGFTEIQDNVGSMENTGVETKLNYDLIKTDDMLFSVGLNASYNKNEVTSLPGASTNANGETILDASERAVEAVGHSFNTYYAVRWAGVNPENGKNQYLDRDGNITETYSLSDRVFIGKSTLPKYQGGFNTSLTYKGFTFDALFSFATGVYRYNGALGVVEDPSLIGIANMSTSLLNAWKEPGDVTNIPSLNTGPIRNLLTDRYIEDASYLRLKNITIGYDFAKNFLANKTPFSTLRIYVQGENLLTWTKWQGFDPEFSPFDTSEFFSFPNSKIATLGIDIKF